jgi:DNA-binding MarR family transcriptional regulator
MNRRWSVISPTECRILSDLLRLAGNGGISPTSLATLCGFSRASLYVHLRRLDRRGLVRRRRVRVRGRNERQVLYAATAAGRRARERFAFECGVWPP